MPWGHDHYVTEEEIPEILAYNLNDVKATKEFYYITKGETNLPLYKGQDKIQLRKNIAAEYDLKCINWNDVKIGDEINKKIYLQLAKRKWKDIKGINTQRSEIKLSECVADFVKFQTKTFKDVLFWLKEKVITGTKGEVTKTIPFANNKFTLKQGGIHTQDLPAIIKPLEDEIILDFDIDSQYPSTILKLGLYPAHLGKEWLKGYNLTFDKRIFAKKNRKVDKKYETINQALKLALNGGGYGKCGENTSWQCDKMVTTKVTVNCQLLILMIVESLSLAHFDIISANTDGVTCKFSKDRLDEIRAIFDTYTKELEYTFEETEYKLIVRTSINDYLALKSNNSIKLKGDFEIDKELHKNPSNRIRAIALARLYVEGIPIEETIKNPLPEYKIGSDTFKGYGIFDYILFVKAKSNMYYELEVAENDFLNKTYLLGKNNRFYISLDGGRLTKYYTNGQSEGVNIGYRVTLANRIDDNSIPININYQFYIDECNKIINQFKIVVPVRKRRNVKKVIANSQLKLF